MIDFLQQYGERLVTAVTALVGAICAIVSLVKLHHTKKLCSKMMEDAKSRMTMVTCPKCHKKSPLNEVQFTLPDGSIDNNLDGLPDDSDFKI